MNKHVLNQVLLESYSQSALAFEGWSEVLLDEYFIQTHLPALLDENGEALSAAQVTRAWAEHVGISESLSQRWSGQITPAVADCLGVLKANLRARHLNSSPMPTHR